MLAVIVDSFERILIEQTLVIPTKFVIMALSSDEIDDKNH